MRTESSKADDRLKIISELKSSPGLKNLHESLRDTLLAAGRLSVRWLLAQPNLKNQSTYCLFLLEVSFSLPWA